MPLACGGGRPRKAFYMHLVMDFYRAKKEKFRIKPAAGFRIAAEPVRSKNQNGILMTGLPVDGPDFLWYGCPAQLPILSFLYLGIL